MEFATNVLRTPMDTASPERVRRFLKTSSQAGAHKFALGTPGMILSAATPGVPLGEYVTQALLALAYLDPELEPAGFVLICPQKPSGTQDTQADAAMAVVVKRGSEYLIDEVVAPNHWRMAILYDDIEHLPVFTTQALAGEFAGRTVTVLTHHPFDVPNTVGQLQSISLLTTKRGEGSARWVVMGALAMLALYWGWFKEPPPEPPVDPYAAYRTAIAQPLLANTLNSALAVILTTAELDAWYVDKVEVIAGHLSMTLSPVMEASPAQEVAAFAARHGYGVDMLADTMVLNVALPTDAGDGEHITDAVDASLAIRDVLAPNYPLNVRFGGMQGGANYADIAMTIAGDEVVLDHLADIARYLDKRPVVLEKITLARPSEGPAFIYNVDIKSHVIGEIPHG